MARVATTSAERHAPRRRAVCVGADVGGTWIRIAVWAEHRVATTVVPADRDLQQLASVLRAVWRRRRWSRRRVAALVVASRGLWTPAERRTLSRAPGGREARVRSPRRPARAANRDGRAAASRGGRARGGAGAEARPAGERELGGQRARRPVVSRRVDPRGRARGSAGAMASTRRGAGGRGRA